MAASICLESDTADPLGEGQGARDGRRGRGRIAESDKHVAEIGVQDQTQPNFWSQVRERLA